MVGTTLQGTLLIFFQASIFQVCNHIFRFADFLYSYWICYNLNERGRVGRLKLEAWINRNQKAQHSKLESPTFLTIKLNPKTQNDKCEIVVDIDQLDVRLLSWNCYSIYFGGNRLSVKVKIFEASYGHPPEGSWMSGIWLPFVYRTSKSPFSVSVSVVRFRLSGFQTLDVPDLCAIQIHYV